MVNKNFKIKISTILSVAILAQSVFMSVPAYAEVSVKEEECLEITDVSTGEVIESEEFSEESNDILGETVLGEESCEEGIETAEAFADSKTVKAALEGDEGSDSFGIIIEDSERVPLVPAEVLADMESESGVGAAYAYTDPYYMPASISFGPDMGETEIAPNYQSDVRNQSVYFKYYNAAGNYVKSRTYNGVTIENDTCWVMAPVAGAESSAILNGSTGSGINLSERALLYFTYNNYNEKETDPLGTLEKDKNYLVLGPTAATGTLATVKEDFAFGGSAAYSVESMAMGIGLVNESKVPYSEDVKVSDLDGSGDLGAISRNHIPVDGKYKFDSDYQLRASRVIDMTQKDAVKKMILEYGGVATSIYYRENYLSGGVCPQTGNHYEYFYNYPSEAANHNVLIVGWNDNIEAGNFVRKKPSKPGAWLCKGTWGADWKSTNATAASNNGYFWISYDTTDKKSSSTIDNVARRGFVFDLIKKETANVAAGGNRLYQYDGSAYSKSITDGIAYANVYKAASTTGTGNTEYLRSVMVKLATPGSVYSVQLYQNPTTGKPESGTPLLEKPVWGKVDAAGYYDVDLGKGISLKSGSRVSVVVRLYPAKASDTQPAIYSGKTGNYKMTISADSVFPCNTGKNDGLFTGFYRCINSAAKNHSYFLDTEGNWNDFAITISGCPRIKLKTVLKTTTEERIDPSYAVEPHYEKKVKDNGTVSQPNIYLPGPGKESGSTRIYVGQTAKLKLPTDKAAVWVSSKSDIATVQDGLVTALSLGNTRITAEVDGVKYEHKIVVIKPYLVSKNRVVKLSDVGKLPINGMYQSATWTSAKPAVLEIDPETGEYRAVGKGKSKVTITMPSGKLVCNVTVNPPKLKYKALTLAPEVPSRQIEYTYDLGSVKPEYSLSKPEIESAICSVDPQTGVVTAKAPGKATVICKIGNFSLKCKINVEGNFN